MPIPATLAPFFQEYDLAQLDPQTAAPLVIERALVGSQRILYQTIQTNCRYLADLTPGIRILKSQPFDTLTVRAVPRSALAGSTDFPT